MACNDSDFLSVPVEDGVTSSVDLSYESEFEAYDSDGKECVEEEWIAAETESTFTDPEELSPRVQSPLMSTIPVQEIFVEATPFNAANPTIGCRLVFLFRTLCDCQLQIPASIHKLLPMDRVLVVHQVQDIGLEVCPKQHFTGKLVIPTEEACNKILQELFYDMPTTLTSFVYLSDGSALRLQKCGVEPFVRVLHDLRPQEPPQLALVLDLDDTLIMLNTTPADAQLYYTGFDRNGQQAVRQEVFAVRRGVKSFLELVAPFFPTIRVSTQSPNPRATLVTFFMDPKFRTILKNVPQKDCEWLDQVTALQDLFHMHWQEWKTMPKKELHAMPQVQQLQALEQQLQAKLQPWIASSPGARKSLGATQLGHLADSAGRWRYSTIIIDDHPQAWQREDMRNVVRIFKGMQCNGEDGGELGMALLLKLIDLARHCYRDSGGFTSA
uniref:FCP1 homology domain-containing protein n=1 Tax=Eutreptiella gymnastica TaxID=73025 RepID=A0A7S1J9V1_9EUGL|mmetsp:Transcript_77379/g.136476  ORF Transcript_77379/g.136476 Transcript_77379/m.136476 type:complete len:440 (+) Transcript_77379:77-1396(+)